ncbi:hypothetical protein [Allosphingosinicella deserti]|nr:hypothetical protein [Sphingomonas deserti]
MLVTFVVASGSTGASLSHTMLAMEQVIFAIWGRILLITSGRAINGYAPVLAWQFGAVPDGGLIIALGFKLIWCYWDEIT